MKDETSPVSEDEVVVRLIWRDYYRPAEEQPVLNRAFLPRPNELSGISVFRLACLADPTDALRVMVPEKRCGYAIGFVSVADLTALGLTVKPARVEEVPGHSLLPELNCTLAANDAEKCRDLQHSLALLAAKHLIPPADTKLT